MKKIVIYDSKFGNTEILAKEIATTIKADLKLASEVKSEDVSAAELVILGTPVHGGRASEPMQEWLNKVPSEVWKGKKVAVFDTRFDEKKVNLALKMLMKTIGYAAEKMAKSLEEKGAELVIEPEGFIVTGKEGPLDEEELERCVKWISAYNN